MELLMKFVATKGSEDHHGDGFLQILRQTQAYLGPYSIKMAHDYIKRFEREERTKQERISFVKMEYFLYAVSEANRNIEELRLMEAKLGEVQDEVDLRKSDFTTDERMKYASSMRSDSLRSGNSPIRAQATARTEMILNLEKTLDKLRFQISMKETELVLQFRELMAWDYLVPEYYFDMQLML